MSPESCVSAAADHAHFIRSQMPASGLFAGQAWRISPAPFALGAELTQTLEELGRPLLQFYRAVNFLYRSSLAGLQPAWVAQWLDQGKPARLLEWQRDPSFKNDLPRVIRPDLILAENGLCLAELDSIPGGIGLTAWLNETYSKLESAAPAPVERDGARRKARPSHYPPGAVIGGARGMLEGFASIFSPAERAHVVISEEAAAYRPEMEWLAQRIERPRIKIQTADFTAAQPGDAVYRFFELFDLAHAPGAAPLFQLAREKTIRLTPPPKPALEEKMLFALLWNGHLREFWRRELGESFFEKLRAMAPYSWVVDPAPLPPHGAIPELNLTDWRQLKTLSQRQRDLILKISGFSERAWGSRGVYLGSDMPHDEWAAAVEGALRGFERSPYILQRYQKPKLVQAHWHDFERNELRPMAGRARLCPFYFVSGDGDSARARLGGVLATICPADKKIIHGMTDAILAPCAA